MTNDLPTHLPSRNPTPDRPLLGVTVLVVEDSRFACEAIRLLCLRSGARIRRADCLASAHRHLAVYRPTAVIVDLGLPDGSGLDLICELSRSAPRVPILIGTSGDDAGEDATLAAGADAFLLKPINSLAAFQQVILAHLPQEEHPHGLRSVSAAAVVPDSIALRDDLSSISRILSAATDQDTLDYIAQFLSSLSNAANDPSLAAAAATVRDLRNGKLQPDAAIGAVTNLIQPRMTGTGPI